MKTLRFEKCGGLNILVGFGELNQDPEATRRNISAILEGTAEAKAVQAKMMEISPLSKMAHDAQLASRQALFKGDKKTADLKHAEFLQYENSIRGKQAEIAELEKPYKAKRAEIAQLNMVYFEPARKDEIAVTAEKFSAAKTALESKTERQAVSVLADGNVSIVDDFSGCSLFEKVSGRWNETKIVIPGPVSKPAGAIFDFELTATQKEEIAAQKEADRVSALSIADKDAEKMKELERVLNEAATMKTKLEIQGDADPLGKSQTWYQGQVDLINAKYA